jgi:hypothetical protein
LPSLPSLLLRNVSSTGNWLEVSIGIPGRGVGAVVSLYEPDSAHTMDTLLGRREIVVSEGYTAGSLPYAHFGLGDQASVDIVVNLPGGDSFEATAVAANQHLRFPDGC